MKPICNTQQKHTKHSAYLALVETIYKEDNKSQHYKGTAASMLREFFSKTSKKKHTWRRTTFRNLLIHVYNQKAYALLRDYYTVQVLYNISYFGNKIVRPIEDWQNTYFDRSAQASSLLQHCFAVYEVPKFMERVFRGVNSLHMEWYLQLGSGKSVKSLSNLPVTLTSKMAHIFRNAPEHFSVNMALRYAQAKGMGAIDKAAEVIASSDLALIRSEHESFWFTVVQFFVKVECISSDEINHITEYVGAKYLENNAFSMKGRTFNALLHQANDWHREKHFENAEVLQWNLSGIRPLYVRETLNGMPVIYKTIELQNSYELYKEGEIMRHCVAEYDDDCYAQKSAIFSLQKEIVGQPVERLATLEIELPSKEILQAKAKYNQEPCREAARMIESWVKSKAVTEYSYVQPQQNNEPVAYRRMVEREQMRTQDLDVTWILRLIFWVLYLLFVVSRVKHL